MPCGHCWSLQVTYQLCLKKPWLKKKKKKKSPGSAILFYFQRFVFAPFYFSASTVVPLNSQLFEWKHDLPLAFPVAQLVKNPPAMQETLVLSQSWEDPLEKGKATHFSILAWRIPWTMGLQRFETEQLSHKLPVSLILRKGKTLMISSAVHNYPCRRESYSSQ